MWMICQLHQVARNLYSRDEQTTHEYDGFLINIFSYLLVRVERGWSKIVFARMCGIAFPISLVDFSALDCLQADKQYIQADIRYHIRLPISPARRSALAAFRSRPHLSG